MCHSVLQALLCKPALSPTNEFDTRHGYLSLLFFIIKAIQELGGLRTENMHCQRTPATHVEYR